MLGGALGPQIKGRYRDGLGGTCALGGVHDASCLDFVDSGSTWKVLLVAYPSLEIKHRLWGMLFAKYDESCECNVGDCISFLNDNLGFTRKEIADWVVQYGFDCEMVTAEPVKQEEGALAAVCV